MKFATGPTGRRGRSAWTLMRRLENKFDRGSAKSCWEWKGASGSFGHGIVRISGKNHCAHRVVYELMVGAIPKGLVLDHTCRNPSCVNPNHLDPVSQRENVIRSKTMTHCPHGHPYSGDNLYIAPSGGRQCRACRRNHDLTNKLRKKQNAF